MSPKPTFQATSKKAKEMRAASLGVLTEGQLHRATVQEVDQSTGYQPPPEAPPPVPRALPESPMILEPEHDENEPPALLFDLPTKRRRGKVSDDNYRPTSIRIHKALWQWAHEVKGKDGWDLADLVNLGMAKLKEEWERSDS